MKNLREKKTDSSKSAAVRISNKLKQKMKKAIVLGKTKETSQAELAENAINAYLDNPKLTESSSARKVTE